MHNLKDLRNNTEFFKKKIKDRNVSVNFKELLELDSIILVTNDNTYSGLDAITKIISNWGFLYKSINLINFLPRFVSIKLYKLISSHRHQISRLIN